MQEETAKVEEYLLSANFTDAIVACFNTPKINAFDPNLLEPLLKILRLSPYLAASLAMSDMYSGISQKLTHKKAVVRLNLLRLIRTILDADARSGGDYLLENITSISNKGNSNHPRDSQLRALLGGIQTLAEKDSAVLVRNLASELVRSHIEKKTPERHNSIPSLSSTVSTAVSSASSSRSSRRLYTPPSLQHATSTPTPMTPTHASSRPSLQSSLTASAALIEVASSPKRSSAAIARERDNAGSGAPGGGSLLAYRPRSKEGLVYRPGSGSRESISSVSAIPVINVGGNSSLPRRGSTDIQQQQQQQQAVNSNKDGGNSSSSGSSSRGVGKVRLSRAALASRPSLGAMRGSGGSGNGESPFSSKEDVASVAERPSPPLQPPQMVLGSPVGGLSSGSNVSGGTRASAAAAAAAATAAAGGSLTPRQPRERRRSRAPNETSNRKYGAQ